MISFSKIENDKHEKKLIKLRKMVNELYFKHHLSKTAIAHKKRVSRDFVRKWTKSRDLNFFKDNRGWPKNKRRKYTKQDEQRIRDIYYDLENNPKEFYTGATVIEQTWRKKYPYLSTPPLRTIGQILKDLGLSKSRKKNRHKGAARYLCYPEYTIYNLLGKRVLEVDFIGKKYISGKQEPLNFIGASFKKPPRLRHFKRISGETAQEVIKYLTFFFKKFEKPEIVKIDNGFAMAGTPYQPRVLSKVPLWLLSQKVIPIYSVPRKPFSQASIEGNNSVFSRKFYNKFEFKILREVDEKLKWFNLSSQKYTGYQHPKEKTKSKNNFIPKIYFIRQVKEDKEQTQKAFINILNDRVSLPKSYINYFVLAEWNLKEETLYIYFEKEQKPKIIKKVPFKINQKSKEKFQKLLKIK